jgi:single-stranded-DNA-specific exonuclease
VDISGLNLELMDSLEKLEPFGAGNDDPRFAVLDAKLVDVRVLQGGGHLRCVFKGANGGSVCAMAYRAHDAPLGDALMKGIGSRFKLAGKAKINDYQGRRTVQFVLDDIAAA